MSHVYTWAIELSVIIGDFARFKNSYFHYETFNSSIAHAIDYFRGKVINQGEAFDVT